MEFSDVVKLYGLAPCTVNVVNCEKCHRVVVLSQQPMPNMVDCPGCGMSARVSTVRARCATSRPLPVRSITIQKPVERPLHADPFFRPASLAEIRPEISPPLSFT